MNLINASLSKFASRSFNTYTQIFFCLKNAVCLLHLLHIFKFTPEYFYPGCKHYEPGRLAQSVTCLATDASLTADPGVASSIPARSHTFVEIDHEIISAVILLPSAESFKKGCCQLQAKVWARSTG